MIASAFILCSRCFFLSSIGAFRIPFACGYGSVIRSPRPSVSNQRVISRSSDDHQRVISSSSDDHQRVISSSSDDHQIVIRRSSVGHQMITSGSSDCHQMVIRGSSDDHQRVIRGPSDGHRKVISACRSSAVARRASPRLSAFASSWRSRAVDAPPTGAFRIPFACCCDRCCCYFTRGALRGVGSCCCDRLQGPLRLLLLCGVRAGGDGGARQLLLL